MVRINGIGALLCKNQTGDSLAVARTMWLMLAILRSTGQ